MDANILPDTRYRTRPPNPNAWEKEEYSSANYYQERPPRFIQIGDAPNMSRGWDPRNREQSRYMGHIYAEDNQESPQEYGELVDEYGVVYEPEYADEAALYYVGEIHREQPAPRYIVSNGYYNPNAPRGPPRNPQYANGPRPVVYRANFNDPGRVYRANPRLYNPYGNGRAPDMNGPPTGPATANEPRTLNPNTSQRENANPPQHYSNYNPSGQHPANAAGYGRAPDGNWRQSTQNYQRGDHLNSTMVRPAMNQVADQAQQPMTVAKMLERSQGSSYPTQNTVQK